MTGEAMSGEDGRKLPPFSGGGRAMVIALAVGAIGLALTVVRGLVGDGAHVALFSYLVAFAYWLGLALGALVLQMIWHASKARWAVVVRRIPEVMAATLLIFPVLFVPIALGTKILYPWAAHAEGLSEEAQHLMHHRAVYLNHPFFFARAAVYFIVWIGLSQLFWRWSTRQDQSRDLTLTYRAWRLGPGALPVAGLTLTFAAFDWMMSLSLHWYSSMWGVYYFAGSFVATFAVLIIAAVFLSRTPSLDGALRVAHWLSLGKFLLAFTCFWAYIAYSQYMLVWVANLPDSTPFLIVRQHGGWKWVGLALILGHFVVPFFLLLSRKLKMKPARLATVGLWILLMHYVDLYWVVMPQVRPAEPLLDWSNVTALVGVGGIVVGFGIWLLRGRPAVPVGDPFLEESLQYHKML